MTFAVLLFDLIFISLKQLSYTIINSIMLKQNIFDTMYTLLNSEFRWEEAWSKQLGNF